MRSDVGAAVQSTAALSALDDSRIGGAAGARDGIPRSIAGAGRAMNAVNVINREPNDAVD
jgi:hypothetical protein